VHSIFIATNNTHKVAEVRAILGSTFQIFSQRDVAARLDVAEVGSTFEANAAIKALTWASYLHSDLCRPDFEWVMGDDSGLEVDALDGAPGIHSARFAAIDSGITGNSPDPANTAKLLRLMERVPPTHRTARFRCAIALVPATTPCHDAIQFFSGSCEGRIRDTPAGQKGFGYDPVFIPEGQSLSFAELGEEFKNRLSHRARALEAVRRFLF
jgi:XTP/dITP diphosphohydrolase